MGGHDYLRLKLLRLKPTERMSFADKGLAFLFFKGGRAWWESGRNLQLLNPGDVLVATPQEGRKITSQPETEAVFWLFTLAEEHLYPLFESSELSLLHDFTSAPGGLSFFPASHSIAVQCHRLLAEAPPQFNLNHRSHLLRVVAAILTEEFKLIQRNRVGYVEVEEHLIQTFESLSAEELLTLSVEELAARFGCSRRHLNRLFHQYFGFAVASLRMEMRLLRAVSLLRDPHAKVTNVAEQCGFNHLGLFNACFKRRFGSSPGEWRKHHAAEPAPLPPLPPGPTSCALRTQGLCPWLGGQGLTRRVLAGQSQLSNPAPAGQASSNLGREGAARVQMSL